MNCDSTDFSSLLSGDNQMLVPLWHRRYAWPAAHAQTLLEATWRAGSPESATTHFAGLIALGTNTDRHHDRSLVIVDGQQRLVTMTLAILALSHHLRDRGRPIRDERGQVLATSESLLATYLYLPGRLQPTFRMRLLPRDDDVLRELAAGQMVRPSAASQLSRTYDMFRTVIDSTGGVSCLYRGLTKVQAAVVSLKAPSDELSETFVRLNS